MAPKITRLPSPYKSRSTSPFKPKTTPGPRPSFKIIERLSLAPLPDGPMFTDDMFNETHLSDTNGADGDWTDEDEVIGTDNYVDESGGQSLTLRDILLQAGDMTQFDLLGASLFLCLFSLR
jgi:hypothetical protein